MINKNLKIPYQEYINDLKEFSEYKNEIRFAAKQLLNIYYEVKKRNNVTILELGVDRGQSTKIFLNAIHNKESSHLISVDIRDCSNVSDLESWKFLKMNSIHIDRILEAAPILKDGIDIIYIDSLHTKDHVYKEIYGWFPYVKKEGIIFLDDIDSGPYLRGKRKDNVSIEISNRKISDLIEAIFMANINILDLQIIKGSTGLGCLRKISNKGSKLNPPEYIKKRNNIIIWKILNRLFFKKQYKHDLNSNNSFLIDVTKY
tara:strand:+ start:10753 stop:11529 length:777 start_codon:yes stop_codon:yes gene_type:complete